MKKVLFAVAAIAVIGISSCSKDCVDCSGTTGGQTAKICKADYEATGANSTVSWSTYSAALKASGCK